jgi:hypothetical protein
MTPDYVTPNAKAPQLSDDDLAALNPEQISRALRLGQLSDLLKSQPDTDTEGK